MFEISYDPEAAREVRRLRARERVRLLEEIETHLGLSPDVPSKRRKRIRLAEGGSINQLRVGDFRVFYDVERERRLVLVRAVRMKGRKTTGEIL